LATHAAEIGQSHLAVIVRERTQHGLDALGFDDGQAATPDGFNNLCDGRVADYLPATECVRQRCKGPLRIQVRGVLREDRADQLVERRIGGFPGRSAVEVKQAAMHPSHEHGRR